MNKPVIAIVGRPNVGKSTLFNKLIGQRLSIVDDTPGVTRDRIYGETEWCGKTAFVVDTGGIEPQSDDIILTQMRRQAQLAIDTASVIILVTDCKSGMVATDMDVAQMLQKSGKPIVLCVNKCDTVGEPSMEFYEFSVSASRFRFPPYTDTARETCSTRCFPTSTHPRVRKRTTW